MTYKPTTSDDNKVIPETLRVLFFHMESCPWCLWLEDEVIGWMRGDDLYSHVEFIKINGKNMDDDVLDFNLTGFDIAQQLDVYLFPTLVLFQGNSLIKKIIGVASKDEYWHELDQYLLASKYKNF